MKNLGIIIQARSTSRRLPGKCLLAMPDGRPVWYHSYATCKSVAPTYICYPCGDVAMQQSLINNNVLSSFDGSTDDVLDRYIRCAEYFGLEHVVRITSDCPLVEAASIQAAIQIYEFQGCDYYSNTPCVDGMDIEVVKLDFLKDIAKIATQKQKEHVTLCIKDRARELSTTRKIMFLPLSPALNLYCNAKLSIDTREDFDRVCDAYYRMWGTSTIEQGMLADITELSKMAQKKTCKTPFIRGEVKYNDGVIQ